MRKRCNTFVVWIVKDKARMRKKAMGRKKEERVAIILV